MSSDNKKYEFLIDDPKVKVAPIILSLLIGAFFAILNETLLNVALITLMEEFNITLPTVQWMTTGFMLVMGVVVPASAVLIQWFTTRQLYLTTMLIFTIGTVTCAMAPNFSVLLIGRLLQAVGTGLIMPIMFNVFLLIYPPHRRGKVLGLVGLVIMFAPAIGPTLSGLIVEYLGWRYLFLIVIPFALFSMIFAAKYLINVTKVTKPKVDFLSLIFSTIAFGSIVYGFSTAGENGFSDPQVILIIGIGLVGLILFIIRQIKVENPLIDLRVFSYPMFNHAVILFSIVIMVMFASEIILPIFMQGPLELTAAQTGLVLLPGALLSGFLSPVMGSLFDKFGPRPLMIPATIILALTMFFMSGLNLDTEVWVVVVGFMLIMAADAAIFMPAETNGLNQLPKELYPHGTAVISTLQPILGAVGVSVFVSILKGRQNDYLANAPNPNDPLTMALAMASGVQFVYLIMFILAFIAFILSFFVYRAVPKNLKSGKNKS